MITDVSIHVDYRGAAPVDVVSYCGLSNNGLYDPNPLNPTPTPLTPVNAFGPLSSSAPCSADVYAEGNAANHPLVSTATGLVPDITQPSGQWDGIVGRLSRDHSGAAPTTTQFHAIVGGYGDDGLFGIAEKDLDTFAVVGTTKGVGQTSPSFVFPVFPLTGPRWTGADICLNTASGGYCHGVVVEIWALPGSVGQPVVVLGSTLIGAADSSTVARDVLWHGGEYYVVGSTTDRDFVSYWPGPFGHPAQQASGYLVGTPDPNQSFDHASYFPSTHGAASALIGVAAWNEYPDHVAVLGWVQPTGGAPKDLVVGSFFRDTTTGFTDPALQLVRQHDILSPGDETSAAIDSVLVLFPTGLVNFTYAGLQAPMGDPGGGGLGVDPRGLLQVVGSTTGATGYPVSQQPGARSWSQRTANYFDAIRSVVDMLPSGVCRSDGTGQCPVAWSPVGDGGTTPACALSPFGNLFGAAPVLNRMFLDCEGVPTPGQPVSFLVDRPPPTFGVALSVWQVGIPNPAPDPTILFGHDVELWTTSLGGFPYGTFLPSPTPARSLRETLGGAVLPPGATYMVQYVCFLTAPLTGTSCTAPDLTWAATPAMVFGY